MAKIVIGVMGPGESATAEDAQLAYELGRLIALRGWVLLTGGREHGVMDAALKGAQAAGGLTVGILPSASPKDVSAAVDIPIFTGLGEARNIVNILSSEVVLVCGMSAGTASEVAFALKTEKPVILVAAQPATIEFFSSLGANICNAEDAADAIRMTERLVEARMMYARGK
jgi:uncharacterized protein (TIGR00725 family)